MHGRRVHRIGKRDLLGGLAPVSVPTVEPLLNSIVDPVWTPILTALKVHPTTVLPPPQTTQALAPVSVPIVEPLLNSIVDPVLTPILTALKVNPTTVLPLPQTTQAPPPDSEPTTLPPPTPTNDPGSDQSTGNGGNDGPIGGSQSTNIGGGRQSGDGQANSGGGAQNGGQANNGGGGQNGQTNSEGGDQNGQTNDGGGGQNGQTNNGGRSQNGGQATQSSVALTSRTSNGTPGPRTFTSSKPSASVRNSPVVNVGLQADTQPGTNAASPALQSQFLSPGTGSTTGQTSGSGGRGGSHIGGSGDASGGGGHIGGGNENGPTGSGASAQSQGSKLVPGAIAGIVIGCLAILLMLIICIRRRRLITQRAKRRDFWRGSAFQPSDRNNAPSPHPSSRSSFATTYDQSLPEALGFEVVDVPPLPCMVEVRDSHSPGSFNQRAIPGPSARPPSKYLDTDDPFTSDSPLSSARNAPTSQVDSYYFLRHL